DNFAPGWLALPHSNERLPQQVCTKIVMLQALRHTMNDGFLKRVMVEDRRVHESGEQRIVLNGGLRLHSYSRPDRIELVGSVAAERMSDCHRVLQAQCLTWSLF